MSGEEALQRATLRANLADRDLKVARAAADLQALMVMQQADQATEVRAERDALRLRLAAARIERSDDTIAKVGAVILGVVCFLAGGWAVLVTTAMGAP
jgi:hypothetical protein